MKQFNENKKNSLDLQIIHLINEIKKPGHELLYDSKNRNYRNNLEKNKIWENIGNALNTDTVQLQKLWKHLKRKYINIIVTNKVREDNIDLVNAMDYFKNFYFTKDDKSFYFNEHDEETSEEVVQDYVSTDLRRARELQLIEELKKVGREALYDYSNPDHKNNFVKKKIWQNIGAKLNISGPEAQKIWKCLKREYFNSIKNESVNPSKKSESQDVKLMKEMNYFKKNFIGYENTETQLDESNSEDIFKDIKLDPLKVKEFQLIEEIKKPGRESLYDSNNPDYVHYTIKNKIWDNIAATLKLSSTEVQKLWRNLKKKYFYRIERKKSGLGIVVPKKIKHQEMLFMLKMSYFSDFFTVNEENHSNSITIKEELKNDSINNIFDEFSSEIYEFSDVTNNSELDNRNPLKLDSDGCIYEKQSDNKFEIVDRELEEEEHEQFYAPKRKKQKFIESATKVIAKINATNDAIIEKLMAQPINTSSKKTVASTFASYLEAVLETKSSLVQNKIISQINEVLKSY